MKPQQNPPIDHTQSPPMPPISQQSYKIPFIVLSAIILITISILVGIQIGKSQTKLVENQPSSQLNTKSYLPLDTSSPTLIPPTPTTDPTANWKTYSNTKYGFEFKYPNIKPWHIAEKTYQQNIVEIYNYDESTGRGSEFNRRIDGPLLKLPLDFISTTETPERYLQDKVINVESVVTGEKPVVRNIENISISGKSGVIFDLSDGTNDKLSRIVFIQVKGGLISFWPLLDYQSNIEIVSQILSTLKFTDTLPTPTKAINNVKKLTYSSQNGWVTSTDSSNTFQLSYDPTKLRTCYPEQGGIFLCAEFGSYLHARVLPYDGGSRHQFIYSNINIMGGAPKRGDLMPDYHEQEYSLDGKSCLFLNGISFSQYPSVWGMCVIDSKLALLITPYDRSESAYEAILKSFVLLR